MAPWYWIHHQPDSLGQLRLFNDIIPLSGTWSEVVFVKILTIKIAVFILVTFSLMYAASQLIQKVTRFSQKADVKSILL